MHVLVVPRRHFSALRARQASDAEVPADALALAARVAAEQGLYGGRLSASSPMTDRTPGKRCRICTSMCLGGAKLQAGLG